MTRTNDEFVATLSPTLGSRMSQGTTLQIDFNHWQTETKELGKKQQHDILQRLNAIIEDIRWTIFMMLSIQEFQMSVQTYEYRQKWHMLLYCPF